MIRSRTTWCVHRLKHLWAYSPANGFQIVTWLVRKVILAWRTMKTGAISTRSSRICTAYCTKIFGYLGHTSFSYETRSMSQFGASFQSKANRRREYVQNIFQQSEQQSNTFKFPQAGEQGSARILIKYMFLKAKTSQLSSNARPPIKISNKTTNI